MKGALKLCGCNYPAMKATPNPFEKPLFLICSERRDPFKEKGDVIKHQNKFNISFLTFDGVFIESQKPT